MKYWLLCLLVFNALVLSMNQINNIAVYCGSSAGLDPYYMNAAFELGEYLGSHQIGLVYGGASVGLMGAVANGCLSKNGSVIGVLPKFLKRRNRTFWTWPTHPRGKYA